MVEAGTVDDSCKERGRGGRKAERREMEGEEQREKKHDQRKAKAVTGLLN